MATYEVLEPGGHAQLVSDIKTYVNRADGVGTTQLADESVTMDKLGEDVIDELDDIMHDGDPLNGNALFGELAEGVVLTADDVYTAPPKGVEVFGVSTQDGTPTPDAPVPIKSVDDLTLVVCGRNILDVSGTASTTISTVIITIDDGMIVAQGSNASSKACGYGNNKFGGSANYHRYVAITQDTAMPLLAGTYTVTAQISDTMAATINYGKIGQSGDTGHFVSIDKNGSPTTFTVQEDCYYIIAVQLNVTESTARRTARIQLEVGSTATPYATYVGQSVEIPLSNHIARSLPDGTHDTLTLSYLEPSTEHEGWGVFSKTLVQRCGHIVANSDTAPSSQVYGDGIVLGFVLDGAMERARGYCTHLPIGPKSGVVPPTGAVWIGVNNRNVYLVHFLTAAGLADINAFRAWCQTNTIIIDYPLATPVTHDLGTVELPVNPAPDLTAWADGGSAVPTMAMKYERDVNIVIEQLEAQIAELLTS